VAHNRYVNTRLWEDNYVFELDPSEKLVFLYLLTNSQTTIAGVYELNLRKASMEIGLDKDMVLKIIQRFAGDGKVYYIEGYIIIRNFLHHQALNPSIKKAVVKEIDKLPDRIRKLYLLSSDGLFLNPGADDGTDRTVLLTPEINKLWIKMEEDRKKMVDAKRATFARGNTMK
jgi:hypothetical protein